MSTPIRFGTDGIRGPAGAWPIDEAGAHRVGQAVASWVRSTSTSSRSSVVVGRDTRASGLGLRDAVLSGLAKGGVLGLDAGVVPTAAVSCAVPAQGARAGIVITASHNPWTDNGLKVLVDTGGKLLDPTALEPHLDDPASASGGGQDTLLDGAAAWRAQMPRVNLSGVHILLDAAHGAGAEHAPGVLTELGATLTLRGCRPNGKNINDGVGAMHPPSAADVAAAGAHLGLCLDGDADRIILVCPKNGVLDGDDLLWLLKGNGPVVGTIMSNGGLGEALGDELIRAQVGDRFVAAEMAASGARIGGEPSGHVLFADGLPTGDGLYAALRVLKVLTRQAPGELSAWLATEGLPIGGWTRWPMASANVRFEGPRRPLDELTAKAAAEAAGNRVIVRYSGTEPVVRILVEGTGTGDAAPSVWVARIEEEFQT
jgi:phosphoglucosamine mutase